MGRVRYIFFSYVFGSLTVLWTVRYTIATVFSATNVLNHSLFPEFGKTALDGA